MSTKVQEPPRDAETVSVSLTLPRWVVESLAEHPDRPADELAEVLRDAASRAEPPEIPPEVLAEVRRRQATPLEDSVPYDHDATMKRLAAMAGLEWPLPKDA